MCLLFYVDVVHDFFFIVSDDEENTPENGQNKQFS